MMVVVSLVVVGRSGGGGLFRGMASGVREW